MRHSPSWALLSRPSSSAFAPLLRVVRVNFQRHSLAAGSEISHGGPQAFKAEEDTCSSTGLPF
eukprot:6873295-Lingulodinium_polyedra.AAC.1